MTRRSCCAVLLAGLSFATLAASADEEPARIAAERAQAQAKFNERQRACESQFVVAPCLDAARKEQRTTLARLHGQEVQLDEAKRRAAAAARTESTRAKALAQQERADAAAARAQSDDERAPRPAKAAASATRGRDDPIAPRRAGAPAAEARRTIEQRNEAQFEARARAAQAHREAVERRNAERAAQGKQAAPLPASSP